MFIFGKKKNRDKGAAWEKEYEDFRQKQYEYIMRRREADATLSERQKKDMKNMKVISLVSGAVFFGTSLWNLFIGAAAGFVLSAVFFLFVYKRNFMYAAVPALMWACTNGFLGLSALFRLIF